MTPGVKSEFDTKYGAMRCKLQGFRIVANDYSVPGKRAKMNIQCQEKCVVVSVMTFEVFGSRKEILARTQLVCLFFFFFFFSM